MLVCQQHRIIDVQMQGLIDFLPIRNVRTLVPQIRTPEGRLKNQASLTLKRPVALCIIPCSVGSHAQMLRLHCIVQVGVKDMCAVCSTSRYLVQANLCSETSAEQDKKRKGRASA